MTAVTTCKSVRMLSIQDVDDDDAVVDSVRIEELERKLHTAWLPLKNFPAFERYFLIIWNHLGKAQGDICSVPEILMLLLSLTGLSSIKIKTKNE